MKSPVRANCTPGSVRGAPGDGRPYLDLGRSKDGLCYRHGAPNGAFPKPESTEASIVNFSFMWSLDTVPSWPPTF